MEKYIDHIFYINLERRQDRRTQIEDILKEYEIEHISERFPAIDYPNKGIVGCMYSHLETIKLAKHRGYKNILILEDDFYFENSKEEIENKLAHFFRTIKTYDVLMFSHNLKQYLETHDPDIRRVIEASTASAYIINESYYDTLIELYKEYAPVLEETMMHWIYANDQIWKSLQKHDNWYCFTERIGRQRPGHSDNSKCYIDTEC